MPNHPLKIQFIAFLLLPFTAASADHFRIIDNPLQALQCRIDLIQQAQKEILVSYYIIKDDDSGQCLLGLLADAARRGVVVRVLMDANSSRIGEENLRWLRVQGVQIRKFRIRRDLRRLWHRLHDKILLTDFNTMMVGGRNLKNEYFGMGEKFNFKDCDALVQSDTACTHAREHFYRIWNRPHLSKKALSRLPVVSEAEAAATARLFLDNRQKISALLSLQFDTRRDWFKGSAPTANRCQLLHDNLFLRK